MIVFCFAHGTSHQKCIKLMIHEIPNYKHLSNFVTLSEKGALNSILTLVPPRPVDYGTLDTHDTRIPYDTSYPNDTMNFYHNIIYGALISFWQAKQTNCYREVHLLAFCKIPQPWQYPVQTHQHSIQNMLFSHNRYHDCSRLGNGKGPGH